MDGLESIVGIKVGPFDFEVEHIHAVFDSGRQADGLPSHTHPVSLTLHFQSIGGGIAFLDLDLTRDFLNEHLSAFMEGPVFQKSFEGVVGDLLNSTNAWIPELCSEFNLQENFVLAELNIKVFTQRDELHHAGGISEYYAMNPEARFIA